MHRKRVTCELHDSYFCLMTIKHAILKIEWAIELLYNSVKTGSQWVWRSDPLVTRCGRESQHSAGWATGLRLSSPGERERHNAEGHKSGGSIYCSLCSVPNSLSHTQPFQIKWEVYFFLKKSSLVFIIASICILHVYVDVYTYEYTTPRPNECPVYDTIWSWGSSKTGAFGDAEYSFITIAPKSAQAQTSRTS